MKSLIILFILSCFSLAEEAKVVEPKSEEKFLSDIHVIRVENKESKQGPEIRLIWRAGDRVLRCFTLYYDSLKGGPPVFHDSLVPMVCDEKEQVVIVAPTLFGGEGKQPKPFAFAGVPGFTWIINPYDEKEQYTLSKSPHAMQLIMEAGGDPAKEFERNYSPERLQAVIADLKKLEAARKADSKKE